MKVVLLKDVRDAGRAHSVIDVSDGHALNYLIPRKLAVPATDSALKQAGARQKQADDRRALDANLVSERLAALTDGRVVITKKANEKQHLYDAVDAKEIAEASGLPVDAIRLEKPIKELGTFEVPVAAGDNFGSIVVAVEAE